MFSEASEFDNSVVANFATTASEGKTYQVEYYNLDMIISVGYRVKSNRISRWSYGCYYVDDRRVQSIGKGHYG